jgi:hypothetical protein
MPQMIANKEGRIEDGGGEKRGKINVWEVWRR